MQKELTGPEQGKLKQALSLAFPDLNELNMLLRESEMFTWNLNDVTNVQQGKMLILSELIQYTEGEGSTGNLLDLVFKAKPNNPKLNNFYINYFYKPIFNDLKFSNLENIFRNINDGHIKKIIIDLFQKYIHSLNEYEKEIIKNYSAFFKINKNVWYRKITLIILILIAKEKLSLTYEIFNLETEKGSSLVLENFVKGFLLNILKLRISDSDKNIKDKLRQWIQENCPEIEIPSEDPPHKKTANYLFIIAEPTTNNRFFLKSQFAQFEDYNTNKKIAEFNDELNSENPQAYSQKEFFEIIDNIIKKMSELKKDRGINGLTNIELFLPIQFLSEDFDIQKIKDDFGDEKPIGMEYPFIVRSYDRFFRVTRNLYDLWYDQWKLLQDKRDNPQELLTKIELVKNTNLNSDNCFGIKVICCCCSKNKVEFFKTILKKGVVFCLWTRYKDANFINSNNVEKTFEDILDRKCLQDFSKLYETVKKIRSNRSKDQNALGYNLGVLFDHDKFPRPPQNLSLSS